MWMLEELGEPYKVHKEQPRSEVVKALNPRQDSILRMRCVIPITAIITYLADKHGVATFPAGTIERAKQDALTHCILDEIDAVLWTAARHTFILPEDKRVPAIKDPLKWEYAGNIDRLMDRLEGPYLMGETFTLADIILAHCGSWARSAGFPSDNARFAEYVKACRARPAFQKLSGK